MPRVIKKSIPQTQRDIADWKNAIRLTTLPKEPKFYLLQDLYDEIFNDALLASQINNRHEQTIAAPFEMVNNTGTVDQAATVALNELPVIADLFDAILKSELYGYSLVELSYENGLRMLNILPRQNIDPIFGRFYPDFHLPASIPYRQAAEFGKWILEFRSGNIGLLNKTVPHVLFKKFAQSCWSELCEIFGVPPRYVKTNTQDEAMLDRAEQMLREMGAAAAFVIDTTEEFQFAQAADTNGDVYKNLINLCNSEMSMIISGAILGQDTQHGNYSKEQAAIAILDRLIASDKRLVEKQINATLLPALSAIGWMPQTSARFRFAAVEDPDKTWMLVKDILPFKDIENEWLTEKFGIPVKDKIIPSPSTQNALLTAGELQTQPPCDDFFV
jgi:hypothetical protein